MSEVLRVNGPALNILFLDEFHKSHQAKMGAFANYSMPFTYPPGLLQEHLHTRASAGLFDISHMGQVHISGSDAIAFLNHILPIPCEKLTIGKARYTLLLDENGGILDDLIVTRKDEELFFVVINAACRDKDIAHISKYAKEYASKYPNLGITLLEDRVLLALQGPKAESVLAAVVDTSVSDLTFMKGCEQQFKSERLWLTRSGYTGEDGFEISVPHSVAQEFAETIVAREEVRLVGLGARDSLRLEAGLPLYGNDMSEQTNPYEAGLGFAISKLRLENKAGAQDFVGAEAVRMVAEAEPKRLRVGIRPVGKAPIRAHVLLYASEDANVEEANSIGETCSGGFAPSLQAPIAFAYIDYAYSTSATTLWASLRGKMLEVQVADLPFMAHNYKR